MTLDPSNRNKSRNETLLAVDPSITCTGWALFESGYLVACGILPPNADSDLRQRISWPAQYLGAAIGCVDRLMIEWPQVYTRAKSKGDPNDLLYVSAVAGSVMTKVAAADCRLVKPCDWKGQVPKPKRGEQYIIEARVLKRLGEAERAALLFIKRPRSPGYDDNAIDAIGLGLYALGRMTRDAVRTSDEVKAAVEDGGGAAHRGAKGRGYAARASRG